MTCPPTQMTAGIRLLLQTLASTLSFVHLMIVAFGLARVPTFHNLTTHFVTLVLGLRIHAEQCHSTRRALALSCDFDLATRALAEVAEPHALVPTGHGFPTPLRAFGYRGATVDGRVDETAAAGAVESLVGDDAAALGAWAAVAHVAALVAAGEHCGAGLLAQVAEGERQVVRLRAEGFQAAADVRAFVHATGHQRVAGFVAPEV